MKLKERRGKTMSFFPLLVMVMLLLLLAGALYYKTTSPEKSPPQINTVADNYIKYTGHELHIDLKKEAYRKLKAKANEALNKGLLYTSKEDLVDANIKIDGKDYACQLRLKGDLLDHLKGHKWSFRIMLKGEEWKGMNTFSIHNSQARAHTAEWVMHELFRQEGIIAPEYDFIKVKLNGQDLGSYAYEHHFEDQLLEKSGRDIGPILKHTDDAYWDNVQTNLKPFPWVEASHIELFNKKRKSDPEFIAAFNTAKAMLDNFLAGNQKAEEVFNLELLAKYYALLDVSHAWHAQQFTNIRFYFNPLSGKLEPIAYDCFGDYLHNVTKNWAALGEGMNDRVDKEHNYQAGNVYRYLLFQNETFSEHYMKHLEKYTAPRFLEEIKTKHKGALDDRNRIIKSDKDYADYTLNWDKFLAKANFTHKKLQPKPALSLKAFRKNGSKNNIVLESYHGFALEVLGYGDAVEMTSTLESPMALEAYNKLVPVRQYELYSPAPVEYVYYRTLGLSQVHKTKLINASATSLMSFDGKEKASANAFSFLKETKGAFSIGSGSYIIDRPMVIPSDATLLIGSGTILTFKGSGSLLSYGKVAAVGTAQNPIRFVSESGNGGGLMISGAQAKGSKLEHCHFIGMKAYKNGSISSTAAVTLYDTEVEMRHCTYKNISAQEALRMELSKAELVQLDFSDCQGSAIRISNSAVKLSKLNLNNIGRNGLIVKSGSIEGFGYRMNNVLNHAMSFSENANVYFSDTNISSSYQALKISSHSRVVIKNLTLKDIERGLEVRGSIDPVTEVEIGKLFETEVENLYLIRPGVNLTVGDKKISAR